MHALADTNDLENMRNHWNMRELTSKQLCLAGLSFEDILFVGQLCLLMAVT